MAPLCYRRHRFPPEIIQHAIWLYLRFTLSYRGVEELLAERGLDISYETVRCWVLKFRPVMPRRLRGAVRGRAIAGTSKRWWCGSPASGCICGGPSITGLAVADAPTLLHPPAQIDDAPPRDF